MNLTRRSLFASAVALLALPRRVAAERLLGPVKPVAKGSAGAVSMGRVPITYTRHRVDYHINGVVVMTEYW